MERSHFRDSIIGCFKRLDTVMAIESQRSHESRKYTLKELQQQLPELDIEKILLIKSIFPESYDVKMLTMNADINENMLISLYDISSKNNGTILKNSPLMRLLPRLRLFSQAVDTKMNELGSNRSVEDLMTFKQELQNNDKHIGISQIGKKAIVKNEETKFQFHERASNMSSNKESILQRIRNKERNNVGIERELHRRKQRFINSKLEMIYNAFYTECPPGSGIKSLTMTQVARILNDASQNPMALEDIVEGVKKLDKAIAGIKYVAIDKVRLVRIHNLNRSIDLQNLKATQKLT
ncbi:hypothetical protein BRETT_000807 [Brettanomyces bruxellensis]|uniref:Uncharacterized protein n=1 Tax=Dekkera bruxellensis TaxID=5007 RepID=A0A871RBC6_DEKBR|nr:uncharacterized protein BRETT_000807 [Brettanomyces bruxellensis]QOU21088.1 hypothetical protein BRETT_000807 [Brettanomyces bruxellensis]